MKPIFKEEKEFLEQNLNIILPNNCWRDGSKIYLNIDTKPYLIEFKAEMNKIWIKKNNLVSINNDNTVTIKHKNKEKIYKNLTIEEEYKLKESYLNNLIDESKQTTKQYILNHEDYIKRVNISGGKDSDMMWFILKDVFNDLKITNVRDRVGYEVSEDKIDDIIQSNEYVYDVWNTTNDTADTYRHVKQDMNISIKDIHTPKIAWYPWLRDIKNWFLPSVMVRNCCSTYKEGQVNKLLRKENQYISFLGMRKYESTKRSKYDWDLNSSIVENGGKLNCPLEWRRFLPILKFRDEDVWLILLHNNVKVNKMYSYGYGRCGCLICPYASDYTDMLTRKYYPSLMNRWNHATEQNYITTEVKNRLKWTLEEWQLGKWKQGTSKEQDLITKKATSERIAELAEIKGISTELASKYFKRSCNCGKKLNPDEIAMNLKLYGRYEGQDDNREFKCKNCICEENDWTGKQYQEKVWEFRNQGCNLF